MPLRLAGVFLLLNLALTPAALASGKKDHKASVTFHLQGDETDNPKMIFPEGGVPMSNGKRVVFRRMPEFGTKDIQSFDAFPSDAGDYGLVIKFKGGAINRLSATSAASRDAWLLAQVNGRMVDGVIIDKQIDDGMLVIWKGVTLADIALLDEALPRIGQEGKKKKKKD
jgi:hypothetical protein